MLLLQTFEDRAYPDEYLFSLIRGRRSRLTADWRPLVFGEVTLDSLSLKNGRIADASSEGAWKGLAREYRWVYVRMNGRLRRIFAPFFQYAELRTLFIVLRGMGDKGAGRTDELLNASLLSNKIKKALVGGSDVRSALAALDRVFRGHSGGCARMTDLYDAGGLRGVERHLANACLSETVKGKPFSLMKDFFMNLIDSRNIMGLYKFLAFGSKTPPRFIEGGRITVARLGKIAAKKNVLGASSLVREFTGFSAELPDPARVELALYAATTRFLRKTGRDPLDEGLILDYLWRCSIEAMNLGLLYHGKDLERDAVMAELVR
jgi:ATP synthase (C/AC39) subunit